MTWVSAKRTTKLPINKAIQKTFFDGRMYVCGIQLFKKQWHDTGGWNPSSYKKWTYLLYIVNIIAVDGLAMQGARASTTMILP